MSAKAVVKKYIEMSRKLLEGKEKPDPELKKMAAIAVADLKKSGEMYKAAPPLTVFKDANNQWRWISITTTAFEDRDKEIISRVALRADVERRDNDNSHGPLRFWHVGTPNPNDTNAPWGPGVDIGDCDFAAISDSGISLIESGTFKSESIARKIAAISDQLEMSPGFFHPINEPTNGAYQNIRIFERSVVPSWAGRASNLFTAFSTTKGDLYAMNQTKRKALAEMGLTVEELQSVLSDVERREKQAQQQGVALKSSDDPERITIGGKTFVLFDEQEYLDAVESEDEVVVVEQHEEPVPETTTKSASIAEMSSEQFVALLGDAIASAMKQSQPSVVAPQKIDESQQIVALKSQIDSLTAQLQTLTAEQPPAAKRAYRATQDPATTVAKKDVVSPLENLRSMVDSMIPTGGN